DVSQQIQREAPWNRDKDQVERRITALEVGQQHLEIEINKLKQQVLLLERRCAYSHCRILTWSRQGGLMASFFHSFFNDERVQVVLLLVALDLLLGVIAA